MTLNCGHHCAWEPHTVFQENQSGLHPGLVRLSFPRRVWHMQDRLCMVFSGGRSHLPSHWDMPAPLLPIAGYVFSRSEAPGRVSPHEVVSLKIFQGTFRRAIEQHQPRVLPKTTCPASQQGILTPAQCVWRLWQCSWVRPGLWLPRLALWLRHRQTPS